MIALVYFVTVTKKNVPCILIKLHDMIFVFKIKL